MGPPAGRRNGRWNHSGRLLGSDGYVRIRVGYGHPLAIGGQPYAYEHLVVWVAAGNPRPKPDELLHHKNEDKADNRIGNLRLMKRGAHSSKHIAGAVRDARGRRVA